MSGLPRAHRQLDHAGYALLLVLGLPALAIAAETLPPIAKARGAETSADIELLEFLGGDTGGKHQTDPLDLLEELEGTPATSKKSGRLNAPEVTP